MAVSASWFTLGLENVLNGGIDLENDSIKVALVKDTYTPNHSHDQWSDVSSNEASGGDYSAGGVALSNQALTPDTSNKRVTFDADDIVLCNGAITARYAVIYDDDSTGDLLLGYVDFGQNESSQEGGVFSITWNAAGILRLTVS